MTQKHKYLIVRADIDFCPRKEDLNKISDWIRGLIKKIDMKLLAGLYTTYVNEKGNKGMTTVKNLLQKLAPSIAAASIIDFGIA